MSVRNLLLSLAAAAAIGLLFWTASRFQAPAPLPDAAPAEVSPVPSARTPIEPAAERAAVPTSSEEVSADLPLAALVTGRVVDASGAAIAAVEVGICGDDRELPSRTPSGPDGRFRLETGLLPCLVAVFDPSWTTLVPGEVKEDAPLVETLVVAAPVVELRGIVVDSAGKPLAGARLQVRLDLNFLAELPHAPNASASSGPPEDWNSSSAGDGRFILERAPDVRLVHLRTSLTGWRPDERTLDLNKTSGLAEMSEPAELRIVLQREDAAGPVLEGTVSHADGTPAAGALVSLGSARTRTDARGAFFLVCGWFDAATPLVAAARGFQPAVLANYGSRIDPMTRSLTPEHLVIPGAGLAIAGRVLDSRGAPCKGWRVALADGTALDPGGTSRDLAEDESGERTEARTDAQGAFQFRGLAARTYVLFASGRDRRSRVEVAIVSAPVPAGSRGVELRIQGLGPGDSIRGRVLTFAGAAVPGAAVGLGRPVRDGSPGEFGVQGRHRATAGADGRFEIPSVPAGLAFLVASGEGILPTRIALEAGARRTDLEIRVRERRPLRFDGSGASPLPDRIRALAGARAPTPIWTVDPFGLSASGAALLVEGKSSPLAVGDDARELVICRGAVELARIALPGSSGDLGLVVWP